MDKKFDGDECNFILMLDAKMAFEMRHLEPHNSVFNLNQPREVTSNLSMPKTVVATVSSWLRSDPVVDPIKLQRMESLFITE